MPRPAYNTSTGFYIGADKKLYDAADVEFHIKGTNQNHYDSSANSSGQFNLAEMNAARFVLYWQNGTTAAQFKTQLTNELKNYGIVAVPVEFWTSNASGNLPLTCATDTASIRACYQDWEDQFSVWSGTENWLMVNPANEWGPENSIVWRDEHIAGIDQLRTAGYLHTIVIDSGGCGQNFDDIINYGQAVFDSDPQKNIIFSIHLYGKASLVESLGNGISAITKANPAVVTYTGTDPFLGHGLTNGNQIIITGVGGMTQVNSTNEASIFFKVKNLNAGANTFELTDTSDVNIDSTGYGTYTSGGMVGPNPGQAATTAHLQTLVDTNLPIVIGEFGPGRNIGPSPTMVWPGQIITGANALNVGWLSWSWDDNNLGGGTSDDNWFAHVYANAVYEDSTDLTIFGKIIVDDPVYGWLASAVKANFEAQGGGLLSRMHNDGLFVGA